MNAPSVGFDWLSLAPALVPAAGALLVLGVDAIRPHRTRPHLVLAVLTLLLAAASAVPGALATPGDPARSLCLPGGLDGLCLWSADPLASTLQIGVLAATLAVVLLLTDRWRAAGHDPAIDITLLLGSAAGGVAVAAARDLGTWLIAFELATLPVVGLVVLRGTGRAAHGALTLIMTSMLSFAVLVVGAGLWLVATGDPTLTEAAARTAWAGETTRPVFVLAVLTLIAGVCFKLSVVPFHAWTPPAFAAAPLPITALLASASKVAALAALVVVLGPLSGLVPGTPAPHAIAFVLGGLALVSMLVGTVVALRALDAVRLLAWSTIAQGGWVLLPLTALTAAGHRAAAGYVLTYAAASLVAFAAVSAVRARADGEPGAVRELTAYRGLLRSHPHVGGPLLLALLVLAGLPPGVLGLVAKVVAFRPVLAAGLWPLAVLVVIAVVLGIAVYLRWVAIMFADPGTGEPDGGEPDGGEPAAVVDLGRGAITVLAVGSAVLVVASVLPQVLYGVLS